MTVKTQNLKKILQLRKNQAVNLQTNKGKMAQRFRIFLVVLLLMFPIKFFGQNIPHKIYCGINAQQILTQSKAKQSIYNLIKNKIPFTPTPNTRVVKTNIQYNPKIILDPDDLKSVIVCNYGVVCRVEYKFQKATTIPLRIRLGSLDYTNYLEQKPNAIKPN